MIKIKLVKSIIFIKKIYGIISILLILALGSISCTEQSYEFQKVEAKSDIDLSEILDRIPAIVSLFDKIETSELDSRMNQSIDYSDAAKEDALKTFMALGELTKEPIPNLIDVVSRPVEDLFENLYSNQNKLFSSIEVFKSLLNTKPYAVSNVLTELADLLAYLGNLEQRYPSAAGEKFPEKTIWSNCNPELSTYLDEFSKLSITGNMEEERKTLLSLYGTLRLVNCSLENSDGSSNDALKDNLAKHIHQFLLTSQIDNPPVSKSDKEDELDYTQDHLDDVTNLEEELANLLVKDSQKAERLNYYIEEGLKTFQNDFLFDELKAPLDLTASFITGKNPHTGEYLVEEVLADINDGIDILKKPQDSIPSLVADLPVFKFAQDIINGPTNSLKHVLTRYGEGSFSAGSEKLLDLLWDGKFFKHRIDYDATFYLSANWGANWTPIFDNETTYAYISNFNKATIAETTFPEGLLNPGNTTSSSVTNELKNKSWSHYRLQMHDILNGNNDNKYYGADFDNDTADGNPKTAIIKINPGYAEETTGESILENVQLYLYEKFYKKTDNGNWAFNQEDSMRMFHDPDRNIEKQMTSLQYTLRNLAISDRYGKEPGDVGFDNLPMLTRILFYLANGAGTLDAFYSPPEATLRSGQKILDQQVAFAGYSTMDTLALPVACNGRNMPHTDNVWGLGKKTRLHKIWRNKKSWVPNLDMFMAEMITPGRFIQRDYFGDPDSLGMCFTRNSYGATKYDPNQFDEYFHDAWRGNPSSQQGDIENANFRFGNLLPSLLAANVWQGYGPFSFRGKAANGSKIKYQNDYFSDNYTSELGVTFENDPNSTIRLAMGNNMANTGGNMQSEAEGCDFNIFTTGDGGWSSNNICAIGFGIFHIFDYDLGKWPVRELAGHTLPKYGGRSDVGAVFPSGNLHIYEKIYRPSSGDACFDEASENGKYSYARWAYIRPSNDDSYTDNTNCGNWERVQVDFDSRQESILANLNWVVNDKKLLVIIPNSGTDWKVFLGDSLKISVWLINQANGIRGFLHMKPATNEAHTNLHNGAWNFYSNYCPNGGDTCPVCNPEDIIGSDSQGHPIYKKCTFGNRFTTGATVNMLNTPPETGHYIKNIPNDSTGLVSETEKNGATVTHHFAKTSFQPGDSSMTFLGTLNQWGAFIGDKNKNRRTFTAIMEKAGTELVFPKIAKTNALENLLTAQYESKNIVSAGSESSNDFSKFRNFYQTFFSTDDYGANGEQGSDNEKDMWQKYERSLTYPACKDPQDKRVLFCLTAKQMPSLPRVKGVSYPETFDELGRVKSWYIHEKTSEYKFQPALVALSIAFGTMEDAKNVYVADDPNALCHFTDEITGDIKNQTLIAGDCRYPREGENLDKTNIKGFLRKEYKSKDDYKKEVDKTAILNESKVDNTVGSDGKRSHHPLYNALALSNLLIENNAGSRDGILAKIFTSDYLHIPSLEQEVLQLINNTIKKFKFWKDYKTGNVSILDKIRYFFSKSVTGMENYFPTNGTESIGGEPLAIIKEYLSFLRNLSHDTKTLATFKKALHTFKDQDVQSSSQSENDSNNIFSIEMNDENIDKIIRLLNERESDGRYSLDLIIDEIIDLDILNIEFSISNIVKKIPELKIPFDKLNEKLMKVFGAKYDLRKLILRGTGQVSEAYVDKNGNNRFDKGEPYSDYNKNNQFDFGSFRGASWYADPFIDYSNKNGANVLIKSPIPNFFDLPSLIFAREDNPNSKNEEEETESKALDRQMLSDVLYLFDDLNLENDVLRELLDSAMNNLVSEPMIDFNNNAIVDRNEFVDVNKNGRYDKKVATQLILDYTADTYHDFYSNVSGSGTLKFILTSIDTLLNPECPLGSSIKNCNPANSRYKTAALFKARKELLRSLKLKSENILDLKDIAAMLLYNKNTNEYTHFLTAFQDKMIPISRILLEIEPEAIPETNDEPIFLEGGIGEYLIQNVELGGSFDSSDLLFDLHTLMNIKAVREFNSKDTLWWQASHLLNDLSANIYKNNKMKYNLDPKLFGDFYKLFK